MKRICLSVLLVVILISSSFAGQLVEIQVQDEEQAAQINELQPHHIIHLGNQYLLYLNTDFQAKFSELDIQYRIIDENIELNDIYLSSPPASVSNQYRR